MSEILKIAISIGDINGIGPEVVVKALSKHKFSSQVVFQVISPFSIIDELLEKLQVNFINRVEVVELGQTNTNVLLDPGHPTLSSGRIAYHSIEKAIMLAVNNEVDAIVTAPISKKALMIADFNYSGHTEILQKFFPETNAQMLFVSKALKLLLLTRHIPFKDVSANLSKELIVDNVRQLKQNLEQDFAVKEPQIAICGLNPHSGELGAIGSEEIDVIIPSIEILQKENINILGPYPPDSFWHKVSDFDCVVALYHDQGLIPVKLLCRDELVNVTSGLPIVRTSPCHGTAYDIAGKGIAREQSMINSIELSLKIVKNRKKLI